MKRILTALFFLSSVVQAVPEYVGIAEKASGQSLGGANLMNDSLYSNPASSAFTSVYSVEGNLQFPRTLAVSVLDTKTSQIGGAFGYFRKNDPGSAVPFQGLKLGFSGRVSNEFGFGAAVKSVWGADDFGKNTRLTDADVGTLWNMNVVQFGLTLRNALGGNPNLREQTREWLAGGRINYNQVLFFSSAVASRWENPGRPYQYGFGVEYVSPYYLSFRGGYRTQPTPLNRSYWGTGVSFTAPKVAMHYSVELPNQPDEKPEHSVAITFLF